MIAPKREMYKKEAQEAKERRQWKQATLLMHQWNALKEKELRETGNRPPPPPRHLTPYKV